MAQFNSYQKIPESSASWGLDAAGERQLQRADWCVTEKIHGANFCWVVSPEAIQCAKRKALLAPTDEFFNYQLVKERLSATIRQVFEGVVAVMKTKRIHVERVYVYGELFGGAYPHPEVPSDPRVAPVQTGVYYSPNIEFCAFDIAIDADGDVEYLDYSTAVEVFEQASLLYAKPLFIGKMQEALNYPIRFTTTIPPLLGLPPLESSNIAEGVVIKPLQALRVQTSKGLIRPILKLKIAEFTEDARYHQAEKWQEAPTGDYLLDELAWDIDMLVTTNRLNNAISKVGQLNETTSAEIARLLHDDVWDELAEKYDTRLLRLSQDDKALVNSVLADRVAAVIGQR